MLLLIDILTGIPQYCLQQVTILHVTNTPYSKTKVIISAVLLVVLNSVIANYVLMSDNILFIYLRMVGWVFFYSLVYWVFYRVPARACVLMGVGQLVIVQFIEFVIHLVLTL